MIQDKIFFDEKDPTGLSYNTPFTFYGSYQGRLWSKAPGGEIKYYTQNSDLSAYATTGSNQFSGSQSITGSLTVTGTITGTVAGTTATASYVEYTNVANKPALVSGSAQIADFGIFATTGSNGFNGSQSITGSLTVTGQVVAQTLNVQQVTSSVVYSSGSNVFGNSLSNTQQFTGSVSMTGSLTVAGTTTANGISSIGREQAFTWQRTTGTASDVYSLNADSGAAYIYNNTTANVLMSWLEGGNVGIGTNNPGYKLEIQTSSTSSALWVQTGGTTSAYTIADFRTGTNLPALQLLGNGTATFGSSVGINGVGATYPLYVRTGTNQRARFVDNGGLFQFGVLNDAETTYSDLSLGNSAVVIKAAGNVGIGTTSPDVTGFGWRTLTIKGGTASGEAGVLELQSPATTGAANLGIIAFLDGSNRNAQIGGVRDGANNSGALNFVTWNAGTGAERMRIASDGTKYFGDPIGSRFQMTANSQNFYQYSNNFYIWGLYNDANDLAIESLFAGSIIFKTAAQTTSSSPTTGTERMRITSGGRTLLLGSSSSGWADPNRALLELNHTGSALLGLRINGDQRAYFYHNNSHLYIENMLAGASIYVISNSGGVYLTSGGTSWTSNSDERLKNINGEIENAVDKLNQLRAVNFSWKNNTVEKQNLGLIAQDVEKVFPELIDKNKLPSKANEAQQDETEYLGVRYQELIPVLVKSIQELSAKIETLEAKIQTLEQQ